VSKIRKSARGEDCALRIPGVCNGDPATTILAHAPYRGRHGSRKHDWFSSYACSDCHDAVDGRLRTNIDYRLYWHDAIHETQEKLIAKGLM